MFSIIGGRLSLRGQTALFYFAFTTPGEVRSTISDIPNQRPHFKLTTVVSGFAKPVNGKYAPNINNGQMKVGEDAYFRAKYDGSQTTLDSNMNIQTQSPAYVLGVADGVGGWNNAGVDPSLFSMNLMKNCKRLVQEGNFVNNKPEELLEVAFHEMEQLGKPVGSSTACVSILNRSNGKLFTANLGDSGLRIFRKGKIVQRSLEQQHSFNFPYQLAIVPPGYGSSQKDMPHNSDIYEFDVEDGDIIALASDGVLDNVYDSVMAKEIENLQSGPESASKEKLQACADSITSIAKKNQQNERYFSPFAKHAQEQGINFIGGKQDDTTLLLASVSKMPNHEGKDEL